MLTTIRHQDTGQLVVVAKLLTGYVKTSKSISDIDSYTKLHGTFDADFVAYMVSWQTKHGCTPDGIIGPDTWTAIAKAAPTCSTAKNRTSGYTLALQLLLGGNLTPDGVYGPRTKAAVVVYQDAHNLGKDGICGPKTWNAMIVGAEPVPVPKFVQPVDYKQGDKRWGSKMYSNHNDPKQTMSNSGCGPTADADVVATLKDPAVTPWTIAQLSMEWGDRSTNNGTDWTLFKPHTQDYYKFTKVVKTANYDAFKACVDAGGYVVCSMKPGYWTKQGHFICAWKYDGTYTYANDPASSTRKKQKTSDFKSECKQYFCFYPDPKADTKDPAPVDTSKVLKRGTKICDISHHQPVVNDYDAFIEDTALIILRAGYRGTGTTGLDGSVKIDTAFVKHADALKARGVRFGVYFYSIANTVQKAREEAQALVKYAKDYNPLFWAIDAETPHITTEAIGAFADELRKLGCGKIGAYVANEKYDDPYHFDKVRDKFSFLWIPDYRKNTKVRKCDLWQYTSLGSVNGISGNVDLNKITGDGHDLKWFIGE